MVFTYFKNVLAYTHTFIMPKIITPTYIYITISNNCGNPFKQKFKYHKFYSMTYTFKRQLICEKLKRGKQKINKTYIDGINYYKHNL